ncbi:uncharacterized protein TA13050 [Theileria annulata]|uniref:Beta-catenin-like protein 1 N-terminal domain-containing protein n=1 Tax=Theileria annulata TaxID=5874 RepID=Q4UEB8_THEAN|nr:uncharacterized protein TA13050 [Theileria annulata]CAI74571.1 hypothetical protein, conserved [Theileria annulata]|eukprot:XP_952303.1 hypothetical protein, conserved [Theileria annulata]
MDNLEKESISQLNIKKNINLLLKRYQNNQNDRINYPENPEKWIKSEVDLEEQIRFFSDLSTIPSLYIQFLTLNGFKILSDILSHQNIDIVIVCINVLSEILDPEIIYTLETSNEFINHLESLSIDKLVVNSLITIQEEDEVDYNGVKSCFELLENLMELSSKILSDLATNEKFLSYLLTRMKKRKTMAYDTNRVYSSELLCVLLQGSDECVVKLGSKEPIDGIDQLLRIIAIYRKRNPDSLEEEELVENSFQALCKLMFNNENQIRFGKIQGIQLMIRLIRERRQTYKLALKLLDFALLDSTYNCQLFVQLYGLKSLFSILMRKGVLTKEGTEQEKQEDENVIGIINSLCINCTGEELLRVINKFVENKHEKLERIVELHKKYTQKSNLYINKMNKKNEIPELDAEEQNYLEKYEAGLSICQLIDCLIVRIYNMNQELSICLLLLLKNKGINIQDIYNHITDYLEHMSEEGKELKNQVEELMINFLKGAKNSEMFN